MAEGNEEEVVLDVQEEFDVGAHVWIEENTNAVWELAEVLDVQGQNLTVRCEGGEGFSEAGEEKELDLGFDQVIPADMGNAGCPDLTALLHLAEPSILHGLNERFVLDNPYTNMGTVLVAVNPCKRIPGPAKETFVGQTWDSANP
eukprot:CAMPEP_0119494382 /NCGR_PEP_ID=MMETSP1344-20130328/18349_1 /TAXON_ID=236787 /ORGANISM="Florenciella parvula, Strain CCMP2471" /LENGTH=144 /DNA_ID=CAMNT_0007529879 /DNA_START=117 /DNA_END=547 /DNA_ORIENTATION=+